MTRVMHFYAFCLAYSLGLPSLHAASKERRYEDDFRLLTFNVFFLPKLVGHWGQQTRAGLIARAEFMKGQDLIILNELFDNRASSQLLDGLKAEYPHQTPILAAAKGKWDETLGSSHPLRPESGGVAIVSKWPIVEKIQSIYASACGSDVLSKKGFVYVKVEKNGRPYHVIGTHAQSEAKACKDDAAVRASQFDEIRRFLDVKDIPAQEMVFIGGDLNVIKDSPEYQAMIRRLDVLEPDSYAGNGASWDPQTNGLAFAQHPRHDKSEYLDYVFVSARHQRPSYWHNQSLNIPSPRWAEANFYFQEYSDHFPVSAFAFADENTPVRSFRPDNQPYQTVYLRHEATGRYIAANESIPNDWLALRDTVPSHRASFRLDNWYPAKQPFCVLSGDFVQLQSNLHAGYYWNWYLGFSGRYGYYLKKQDSSNLLRLHILGESKSCLGDGDRVYFVDKDTLKGRDAHIQYWPEGSWRDHLFLWSSEVGRNETFTVEIPTEPVFAEWSERLRYGS